MFTHTDNHTGSVPLAGARVLDIHSGADSNARQCLGGAVIQITDILGRSRARFLTVLGSRLPFGGECPAVGRDRLLERMAKQYLSW